MTVGWTITRERTTRVTRDTEARKYGRRHGEGGRGPAPQGPGQPPQSLPQLAPAASGELRTDDPDGQAMAFRTFGEQINEIGLRQIIEDRPLTPDEVHAVAYCCRNLLVWCGEAEAAQPAPGLDVESRLWQYADHLSSCLSLGPFGTEHPDRPGASPCDCGFASLVEKVNAEYARLRGGGR